MKITELIIALEKKMAKHGDIEAYAENDDSEYEIDRDIEYEKATSILPERIVIG